MDDPPKEISSFVTAILNAAGPDGTVGQEADLVQQREAIQRCTTEAVEFVHPWATIRGREKLEKVYEFWARQNW